MLDGEHKVPLGGGFFRGNTKIPVLSGKAPGALGVAIYPDPVKDNTIIVWGYNNTIDFNSPQIIKISEDGGLSWRQLDLGNEVSRIWFSDTYERDGMIYAHTQNKIIISHNKGDTWEDIYSFSTSILDVDVYEDKIATLTESGLQISVDNGLSWTSIDLPQNTLSVEVDTDGTLYISTNKEIFKRIGDTWENINAPFRDELVGCFW